MTQKRLHSLSYALWILSSQDDGAYSRDQVGFTSSDAKKGNRFAAIPEEKWTTAQRHMIWKLLQKYHRQLAIAGVDISIFPEPIVASITVPKKEQPIEKTMIYDGVFFRILIPYDKYLIEDIKTVPSARFHTTESESYWTITDSHATRQALRELKRKYPDFVLSETVSKLLFASANE